MSHPYEPAEAQVWRELSAAHPGWYVWYTPAEGGVVVWGAQRRGAPPGVGVLRARDPGGLEEWLRVAEARASRARLAAARPARQVVSARGRWWWPWRRRPGRHEQDVS